MALSPAALTTAMQNEFPSGAQSLANWSTLVSQAITDGVAYGQARFRERVDAEFWGDGVTTRFALTGREVRLLDPDDWPTPTNLNTAGIDAPSATATYTPGTGGSLPVGTYLATYAFETAAGVSSPIAVSTVVVAASGTITRSAVTVPTGATVADYLSVAAGSGELRRVATGGSGTSLVISAVPSGSAPHAQLDYTDLSTLSPDLEHLEPGIAADGTTNSTLTTVTLANAPAAGARFRIPYTRIPIVPTDTSVAIGLDDDYLRLTTRAHLCALISINATSGDSTLWASLATTYFQQLDALLAGTSGRRPARVRFVSWS